MLTFPEPAQCARDHKSYRHIQQDNTEQEHHHQAARHSLIRQTLLPMLLLPIARRYQCASIAVVSAHVLSEADDAGKLACHTSATARYESNRTPGTPHEREQAVSLFG